MIQNPGKHQALVLGNINHETKLICANKSISIANEMKLLAVTLDNKLKFDSHVATISRKVEGQVNALNRLKTFCLAEIKKRCIVRLFCSISLIAARFGTIMEREIREKLRGLTSAPCDTYTRTGKHLMKSCSSGSD